MSGKRVGFYKKLFINPLDRATHLEGGFIYIMKKKKSLLKKGTSVNDMIVVIDNAIKEVTEQKEISIETSGHALSRDIKFYSVKDHDTKRGLIKMYAHVLSEEKIYFAAAKDMGLEKDKVPELLISGHSAKAWKQDILSWYNEIDKKEVLNKLNNAKSELKKNQTKEERLAVSLNEVSEILSI